ncbi:MAG: methyltransferase domain-containing protein [Planctomycetes bacterium]|nr:methyltransferase domain-containing protein [Planctomycetota bacterium]
MGDSLLDAAVGSALQDPKLRLLLIAPGPHGEAALSKCKALTGCAGAILLDAQPARLRALSAALAVKRTALGRAPRLPFRRHSFDAIVSLEALFAIRPPWTVIAEFHRVLAPDGKLILLEPSREGLFSKVRSRLLGPGKRVYALEEVENRLTRADFAIEEAREMPDPAPYPLPAYLIVAAKKENMAEPVPQVITTRDLRARQKPYPKGEELP